MAIDHIIVKDTENVLIDVIMVSNNIPIEDISSSNVIIKYHREGSPNTINLGNPVKLTNLGVWQSDAWGETDIEGLYQYGIPNICLQSGSNAVTLFFYFNSDLISVYKILLTDFDFQNPNSSKSEDDAQASYEAIDDIGAMVEAIKNKTDNLPTSPANEITCSSILNAVQNQNDISVEEIVTGIMQHLIDGDVDIETATKRVLACVVNSNYYEMSSDNKIFTSAFKDSDNKETVVTKVSSNYSTISSFS